MLFGQSSGMSVPLPGSTALDLLPITLGANTNNLASPNLLEATGVAINAVAALNLTGIAGATRGRFLMVAAAPGSSTVTLKNGSGLSDAGNRLLIGADIALTAGAMVLLVCINPSEGWRLACNSLAGGGGGGGGGFGIGSSSVASVSAAPVGTLNNYAPAGWSAATTNQLRLTPGLAAVLNGLDATGVSDNWTCILTNDDPANNLTLANEAAASTAANRITGWGGADIVVVPGQMILLAYVGNRWRVR